MFSKLSAVALALLPLVLAQDVNITVVESALKAAKVIPDVIPANFVPRFPLSVIFTDDHGSTFPVTAGANLTTNQTAHLPSFAIISNITQIKGKPYLMAIVDPDALTPQNPNEAQFRHFLGADYISNGSVNGEFPLFNQSKSADLTPYTAPAPPATSDPHRYVVLCYLQNSTGVTAPTGFNASDRTHFNITSFVDSVKGNNFTLLAATFFWVSANDTVGSVKPNSTSPGAPPAPSGTAPGAAPSGNSTKTGAAIAMKPVSISTAIAWSVVGMLSATGALLL